MNVRWHCLIKSLAAEWVLLALLCAVASPVNVLAQKTRRAKEATLFAVTTRNGTAVNLEPVVSVIGRRYLEPVSGESNDPVLRRFAASNYRAGQVHQLLFGGARIGTVRVTNSNVTADCNRAGAQGAVRTDVKLGGSRMALATNSAVFGTRTLSQRRAPNAGERVAAIDLARRELRRQGISNAGLQTLSPLSLMTFDSGKHGATIVGSFTASPSDKSRSLLFLIAAQVGGKDYRVKFAGYEAVTPKDIMAGADFADVGRDGLLAEMLVDALDINGDGTAEIVTIKTSFEGATYRIYAPQNNVYMRVYEFYSYRCAF